MPKCTAGGSAGAEVQPGVGGAERLAFFHRSVRSLSALPAGLPRSPCLEVRIWAHKEPEAAGNRDEPVFAPRTLIERFEAALRGPLGGAGVDGLCPGLHHIPARREAAFPLLSIPELQAPPGPSSWLRFCLKDWEGYFR